MTAVVTGENIAAMSTLGERLQQVMALRGVSASKLSLDAGLSRTAVQKIIDRGGARTSSETISGLAAAAKVSREWLETGRGEPDLVSPPVAPPDLTLEREDTRVPEDDEVPLETALFQVFAAAPRGRYTTADFDAARAAIRGTHRKAQPDGDQAAHAEQLLDAARALRLLDVPATVQNVLTRALEGKTQRNAEIIREVSAAYNAAADESLRAKGHEPEQGKRNLDAARAKLAATREKRARREE